MKWDMLKKINKICKDNINIKKILYYSIKYGKL